MPGLLGRDGFEEVAAAALELPGVDGVEVLLMHEWGGNTRFANSEIHQSTAREDTDLRVRVISKDRVGVSSTNECTREGARRAAESAKEMAEIVSPDQLWPGLTPKTHTPDLQRFDEATASASPEERAEAVATLIGQTPAGFVAAGAYETMASEVGLANTEGQVCWGSLTQASITTVMNGGGSASGFAELFSGTAGGVDAEAVGRKAAAKAAASRDPKPLDPGIYPVVLEPAAVGTLAGFLAWVGFGGRDYFEDRSCFSGKEGERVAAPGITIVDDPTHADTLALGFDFEGEPHRRVDLITDGVFQSAVYDRRIGKEAGVPSTGHGLPSPNPEGPFPLNLSVEPGNATVEQMIAATERGVLVTRFHYSNVVNPVESSITGMTRDGTFLIENGEIAGPVMNFRFTQSIIAALSSATMVGNTSELASEFFFSSSRVPALKIEEFNFSGRSDH
ncbi:MAG: PmbA protein [Actinomycetota bacterium]|jgi:predicted Zn-dependent protease|nr:PmbA protein [Actinomycetota bacterium]